MSDKQPRCWVLEKGGDRCVLVADHPGPHMGGYHTFESIPPTEEMARLIGTHCDQLENVLRLKVAALTAENERLRAEWGHDLDAAISREDALRLDLARVTEDAAKECGRLRDALDRDRTGLAHALARAREVVRCYAWIPAGEWGCYDYTKQTCETLRAEVANCFDEVIATAEKALRESGTLATQAIRGEPSEADHLRTKLAALRAAGKDVLKALDDAAPLGQPARWWEPLESNRINLRAALAASENEQ